MFIGGGVPWQEPLRWRGQPRCGRVGIRCRALLPSSRFEFAARRWSDSSSDTPGPSSTGLTPSSFPTGIPTPTTKRPWPLFASAMAYGGVIPIRRAVERILSAWSEAQLRPAEWVRSLGPAPGDSAAAEAELLRFASFRHRLYVGADVVALGRLLGRSWAEHGSLGGYFVARWGGAPTLGAALDGVMRDWKAWAAALSGPQPGRFFFHLLAAPRDGSACKRWCMFLRWMVRRDSVDLGLWGPGGALARAQAAVAIRHGKADSGPR
ncbi:MAG: DUF2400 family protein [Bdellovibrionales bacterium]|nr:DUF2400 family protein [Bdellovibrionales bacterium]